MSPEQEYLSLEDVAELLGVNYQLIYKLVRSGELPAVRLGRVYRVQRSDLDRYLARSRHRRWRPATGVRPAAKRTPAPFR